MPDGSTQFSFDSDQFSEHPWLTAILDEIPVGIGIFDPTGRLCHANRRFVETAGGAVTCPEAADAQGWKAFTADGHPLSGDLSAYVQESPRPSAAPTPCTPTNGDCDQQSRGLVVVENLRDIRFAPERQSAEARFRCFAEHSSNVIVIADVRSGKIDYLSPSAERIWTDHARIATIADWEASIHPDDLPFVIERRELVRQGLFQSFQYRIVDRQGLIAKHVRDTSFPMPSEDGAVGCIGCIVEDISPEMPIYLVQATGACNSAIIEGLRTTAYRVTTFSSQKELMNVAEVLHPGCVVVDLLGAAPAPEVLLRLLKLRPVELQVILVGPPETPSCDIIDALKAGAADYLVDPVASDSLAAAVHKASEALADLLAPKTDTSHALRDRLASLPIREREVFLGLVGGGTNKSIARKLQLSPRTVEVHRAHLMQRLNVRSLTELLHLAHDAGIKVSQ